MTRARRCENALASAGSSAIQNPRFVEQQVRSVLERDGEGQMEILRDGTIDGPMRITSARACVTGFTRITPARPTACSTNLRVIETQRSPWTAEHRGTAAMKCIQVTKRM